MSCIKLYLFALFASLIFLGCKKYPENTIYSNHPEKFFKGGKITSYKVNGVERMQYYRDLYKNFPYNYIGHSIPDIFELPFTYDAGSESFVSDYGEGSIKFSETKREVELRFQPVYWDKGAENIFVHDLCWKIIKLNKSGQMKLQAKYEFKLYEIGFN
jgi:hypothetical protein